MITLNSNSGPISGASVYLKNCVYVNPDLTEVAGVLYNTIENAIIYINTQVRDARHVWAIMYSGLTASTPTAKTLPTFTDLIGIGDTNILIENVIPSGNNHFKNCYVEIMAFADCSFTAEDCKIYFSGAQAHTTDQYFTFRNCLFEAFNGNFNQVIWYAYNCTIMQSCTFSGINSTYNFYNLSTVYGETYFVNCLTNNNLFNFWSADGIIFNISGTSSLNINTIYKKEFSQSLAAGDNGINHGVGARPIGLFVIDSSGESIHVSFKIDPAYPLTQMLIFTNLAIPNALIKIIF